MENVENISWRQKKDYYISKAFSEKIEQTIRKTNFVSIEPRLN